jgi:hypothetical protein
MSPKLPNSSTRSLVKYELPQHHKKSRDTGLGRVTTLAVGEEASAPGRATTLAVGEEGGSPRITTQAVGEESGGPQPPLDRMTTLAVGEEGSH